MKNILLSAIVASMLIGCNKPQDKFVGHWEMKSKNCEAVFDIGKNQDSYILESATMMIGDLKAMGPYPLFTNAGLTVVNDTTMNTPSFGTINYFTLTYISKSDQISVNPNFLCGNVMLNRVKK